MGTLGSNMETLSEVVGLRGQSSSASDVRGYEDSQTQKETAGVFPRSDSKFSRFVCVLVKLE